MMNLVEFFTSNFTLEEGPFVSAILLGIIWMIVYDFYHVLFSAVLTWFKK